MRKRKFYHFLFYLLCLLSTQSLVFPQVSGSKISANLPTENSATEGAENLIHIGDLIDVDVIGSTEYDWRGRLNPEGFLDGVDYLEEPVYALCQTEESVGLKIAKGYEKLLKNPQVSVKIIDQSGRPVSVLYGAVKTPQRFKVNRPVYLNELIILAGGFTEKTSGEIQILRPPGLSCAAKINKERGAGSAAQDEKFVPVAQNNEAKFINIRIAELLKGNKEANPLILTGDVVTVLEAEPIYVIGGVMNPKQINASAQLSVTRAIDSAGGFAKDADQKKITVFRRAQGETKIIEVSLEKIQSNQAEDLLLQAFDIVDVGVRGGKNRKFPPVIKAAETSEKNYSQLPLRIID